MNKQYLYSQDSVKSLYDADYWKKFVESYRCRICKIDLTLDNFGKLGVNHMIMCKDCAEHWEFNTDSQEWEYV